MTPLAWITVGIVLTVIILIVTLPILMIVGVIDLTGRTDETNLLVRIYRKIQNFWHKLRS